jgi:hypothetical protein
MMYTMSTTTMLLAKLSTLMLAAADDHIGQGSSWGCFLEDTRPTPPKTILTSEGCIMSSYEQYPQGVRDFEEGELYPVLDGNGEVPKRSIVGVVSYGEANEEGEGTLSCVTAPAGYPADDDPKKGETDVSSNTLGSLPGTCNLYSSPSFKFCKGLDQVYEAPGTQYLDWRGKNGYVPAPPTMHSIRSRSTENPISPTPTRSSASELRRGGTPDMRTRKLRAPASPGTSRSGWNSKTRRALPAPL